LIEIFLYRGLIINKVKVGYRYKNGIVKS